MLLSEWTNRELFVNQTPKGVCLGVGISLKSCAVKYLLCSSETAKLDGASVDFAVNATAAKEIGNRLVLSRLRPVFPKNCAKLTIGLPLYSSDGALLGTLIDVEIRDNVAVTLFSDKHKAYPVSAIAACMDAVLLKKEQPYPLGQPIPAPYLFTNMDKKSALVTRPVLRSCAKQGELVKLTLSLAPFGFQL